MKISFVLNGEAIHREVPADRRVVDLLREDFGLTGTKEGCGTGECGACTIIVDGKTSLSCLLPAAQLDGSRVLTIEGLSSAEGDLHPVQQSFVDHGAVQCGFCTPGMILTAAEFLERHPSPGRQEITAAISGNLCRCTGYRKILDAIEAVAPEAMTPVITEGSMKAGITEDPVKTICAPLFLSSSEDERPVFLPGTLEELFEILSNHPEARVFAGGTDLMVWIRNRRINPPALIGLERIDALSGIIESGDGVRIGAGTSHETLLEDSLIRHLFPVLTQAIRTLGSPHIRRMGTIGGNIVTASPAGDTLPPLHVLGAEVELLSAEGARRMPLSAFINGPGKTALKPGEILRAVWIPRPAGTTVQYFEKVGLRGAMACSVASFAALIGVSASGIIESARLAWGSVGPTVMCAPAAEAALTGRPLTRKTLETLIPLVGEAITPIDDVRASAGYRRRVAGNLLLRLLQFAAPLPDATPGSAQTEERH
ncbi:MAG: FAD binding domain-containing protein [Pseudomonadota bacterium]